MKTTICIFAVPLALALSGCGGGEGAAPAAVPVPSVAAPFAGTAYQKQQITSRLPGKDYGSKRKFLNDQVDACNRTRDLDHDHLPPVFPEEAALTDLDVGIYEHYFDTNKAAIHITGRDVELKDWWRWLAEAAGGVPAVPPDCSVIEKTSLRAAFIWRDGLLYLLNFDTREGQVRSDDSSLTPKVLATEQELQALPQQTILGERCYVVEGEKAIPFAGQQACVWDLFPPVAYLGSPWVLSRYEVTSDKEETEISLELDSGMPIDPSLFEIPADFTITNE